MATGTNGGAQEHVFNLVSRLDPEFYDVSVVSLSSGSAVRKLQRENPYPRLDTLGRRVRDTLLAAAQAKGIPLQVPQVGSMFSLYFNTEKVRNYDQAIASNGDLYRKVFRTALDHGVYLAPSPYETAFISTAHEGADIDKACEVLDAAVRAL